MDKAYEPQKSEDDIYKKWEESGVFQPSDAKKTFTIPIPPPNVTGTLHAGHSMFITLQDIMIRWHRMMGESSLWIPGPDHAAIATETVVLKSLGIKDRNKEISREDFLEECKKWISKTHMRINEQIRKMGASCDWSREAYTLDDKRNHAVNTLFKMLYDKGLIYRGNRLINWSIGAQSVLADDEVEWGEKTEPFYYIRCGEFIIGTVRPETKCADSPVVVSKTGKYVRCKYSRLQTPDSRLQMEEYFIMSEYLFNNTEERSKVLNLLDGSFDLVETFTGKELEGKEFEYETYAGKRKFVVLADEEVIDIEKGAGTMTISCSHSADDYDLAKRRKLDDYWIQKLDFEGNMTSIAGPCAGMNVNVARKKSAQMMREQGLLVGEDKDYVHRVPLCYRSHTVVEPMVSKQWFIAVEKEFTDDFSCQKIIFARHGESIGNAESSIDKNDTELTKKGQQQAEKLAQSLEERNITKILSSPLKRAKETADIIANILNVQVEILEDSQEVNAPYFSGEEALFQNTEHIESDEEIFQRSKSVWKQIKQFPDDTLLVIGHDSFLCALFSDYHKQNESLDFRKNWALQNCEAKTIKMKTEKTTTLKKQMQEAVRNSHVEIIPGRFEKTYFHWIDNLQDWCISRQIWWGHRIPVWYGESGKVVATGFLTEEQKKMNLRQDEDTLDTWFSSALWPFSILDWPNTDSTDFQKFYPTDVLETGHDILFFWVARMIMFGKFATGEYPFQTVYLHGLVQDEKGKKMSKSKGNGIDPLEIIEEFGTDALRLSLIMGMTPGNNANLGKEKIAGCRNFCNKLWNVSRFVLSQEWGKIPEKPETDLQKWIINETDKLELHIHRSLTRYQFGDAAEKLWNFTWNEFADWAIESVKAENNQETNAILKDTLRRLLILLHPFIPFVTEKIWEEVQPDTMLITEKWKYSNDDEVPRYEVDTQVDHKFLIIQNVISKIRSMRKLAGVDPTKKITAYILGDHQEILERNSKIIKSLARLEHLEFGKIPNEKGATDTAGGFTIFLPSAGMIDPKAEKARAKKELEKAEKMLASLEGKLGNEGFVKQAPKELVEKSKQQVAELKAKISVLQKEV